MRKPRLNSAVATVAVETVFSLLRVASVSFNIGLISLLLSFRDAPPGAGPESILTIVVMDSGFALRAPRNDGVNKSTARRPARQNRFRENRSRSLRWPA